MLSSLTGACPHPIFIRTCSPLFTLQLKSFNCLAQAFTSMLCIDWQVCGRLRTHFYGRGGGRGSYRHTHAAAPNFAATCRPCAPPHPTAHSLPRPACSHPPPNTYSAPCTFSIADRHQCHVLWSQEDHCCPRRASLVYVHCYFMAFSLI